MRFQKGVVCLGLRLLLLRAPLLFSFSIAGEAPLEDGFVDVDERDSSERVRQDEGDDDDGEMSRGPRTDLSGSAIVSKSISCELQCFGVRSLVSNCSSKAWSVYQEY